MYSSELLYRLDRWRGGRRLDEIERAAPIGAALVITEPFIARSVTVSGDDAEARRDAREGGQAGGGHRVDVRAHRITNLVEFNAEGGV
jgi:hypothetical protein